MDLDCKYFIKEDNRLKDYNKYIVKVRADCTALPWGNGIYCKLKLKREEEELIIRLKYLNNYGRR